MCNTHRRVTCVWLSDISEWHRIIYHRWVIFVLALLACCIWHCWHYIAFGTVGIVGTVVIVFYSSEHNLERKWCIPTRMRGYITPIPDNRPIKLWHSRIKDPRLDKWTIMWPVSGVSELPLTMSWDCSWGVFHTYSPPDILIWEGGGEDRGGGGPRLPPK